MDFQEFESSRSSYASKAIAGAMKALQNKIKFYQNETSFLSDQKYSIENKLLSKELEFDNLLHKRNEEVDYYQQTLEEAAEKLDTLQKELDRTKAATKNKLTAVTNENHRLSDENARGLEEIEKLKQQVEAKSFHKLSAQSDLSSLSQKSWKLEEKLKQLKETADLLTEELGISNRNLEVQRMEYEGKLQEMAEELENSSEEYRGKMRKAEAIHTGLLQENIQLKKEVGVLRNTVKELKRANELAGEAYASLKHQYHGTQNTVKEVIAANEQLACSISRDRKKSSSPRKKNTTKKKNKLLRASSKADRDLSFDCFQSKVERDIKALEKAIAELNDNYKSLLQSSFGGSGDIGVIRNQLNKIARAIESSSEELFKLKRRQQQSLRENILNFQN